MKPEYDSTIARMAGNIAGSLATMRPSSLWDTPATRQEITTVAVTLAQDIVTALRGTPQWRPILTAPQDGTEVYVYAAGREGLPPFITVAAYHIDAGWCVDELREVTHWMPKPSQSGNLAPRRHDAP